MAAPYDRSWLWRMLHHLRRVRRADIPPEPARTPDQEKEDSIDLALTESERSMLQQCADAPGMLHPRDFNEQGQAILMHLIRRRLLGVTWKENAAYRTYFLTDAGRAALAAQ
jgi:hypothetical protein